MPKIKAPPGITSVSVGGKEYKVRAGTVSVPSDAVAGLAAHGFPLADQIDQSDTGDADGDSGATSPTDTLADQPPPVA